MSQADILKILELKIKQAEETLKLVKKTDLQLNTLWVEASKKEDLALMLGISIDSISKSLAKLIVQDKIVSLQHEKDKRYRKYMMKNELVNNMVSNGNDKR